MVAVGVGVAAGLVAVAVGGIAVGLAAVVGVGAAVVAVATDGEGEGTALVAVTCAVAGGATVGVTAGVGEARTGVGVGDASEPPQLAATAREAQQSSPAAARITDLRTAIHQPCTGGTRRAHATSTVCGLSMVILVMNRKKTRAPDAEGRDDRYCL